MEREWYNIYEVASLLECQPRKVLEIAKKLGWENKKDNYGREMYFPVCKIQSEMKRRIGEIARLQSSGLITTEQKKYGVAEKSRRMMWLKAKGRAKKAGIDFSLSMDDIVIPQICPLLGMVLSFGKDRCNVPSLDRIDNTQGYTSGNVWVISEMANRMKQNASIDQLRIFAKNILENFPDT